MTIKNLETLIILRPQQGRTVLAKQEPPQRPSEAFQHAEPLTTGAAARGDRPLDSFDDRGEQQTAPSQIPPARVAEAVYQLIKKDVLKDAWRAGRGGN